MPQPEINYLAVLVVAVIYYVIGALWYSPALFGKTWLRLVGRTPEELQKGVTGSYVGSFIAALLMAYVLAHIISFARVETISAGLQGGFWCWVGFVATAQTTNALFSKKPWKVHLIDVGYHLVGLLVMGAILALWR